MLVFRGLFQTKNKTKNNIVMHTEDLDMQNIPQHIAIIMDGNGRWAKAQGKVRTFGHQAGAETLKTIVRAADKLGVKVISAYAFSTENWKRPVTEVNFIMELLSRYLTNLTKITYRCVLSARVKVCLRLCSRRWSTQ